MDAGGCRRRFRRQSKKESAGRTGCKKNPPDGERPWNSVESFPTPEELTGSASKEIFSIKILPQICELRLRRSSV